MKLGQRRVEVLPNEFLKRSEVRTPRGDAVKMSPAEADVSRSNTQVNDGDVHKAVRERLTAKWAGDLMSTDEELEEFRPTEEANYPSRHRDDDRRRQMGY